MSAKFNVFLINESIEQKKKISVALSFSQHILITFTCWGGGVGEHDA